MKKKLSEREIDNYAEEISDILNNVPLFYINEVLELANEIRQKAGSLSFLDVTSDSDVEEDYASDESN